MLVSRELRIAEIFEIVSVISRFLWDEFLSTFATAEIRKSKTRLDILCSFFDGEMSELRRKLSLKAMVKKLIVMFRCY